MSVKSGAARPMRLRGGVDGGVLRRCAEVLAGRHEVLRSGLVTGADGRVEVVVAAAAAVPWSEADLRGAGGWDAGWEVVRAGVREPFDLSVVPLLRGGLVRCADDG